MSTNGASVNIGATAFDVGDFTTLLLDINPTYTIGGYPEAWTQFTINLNGVPPGVQAGLLSGILSKMAGQRESTRITSASTGRYIAPLPRGSCPRYGHIPHQCFVRKP
jgi:hypothetical protein